MMMEENILFDVGDRRKSAPPPRRSLTPPKKTSSVTTRSATKRKSAQLVSTKMKKLREAEPTFESTKQLFSSPIKITDIEESKQHVSTAHGDSKQSIAAQSGVREPFGSFHRTNEEQLRSFQLDREQPHLFQLNRVPERGKGVHSPELESETKDTRNADSCQDAVSQKQNRGFPALAIISLAALAAYGVNSVINL